MIDRLARTLAQLIQRGHASEVWCDDDNVPRVFGPAPDFAVLLRAAFDQLRESGAGHCKILLRIAESLKGLCPRAKAEHVLPIALQLTLLESVVKRSLPEIQDREEIGAVIAAARGDLEIKT